MKKKLLNFILNLFYLRISASVNSEFIFMFQSIRSSLDLTLFTAFESLVCALVLTQIEGVSTCQKWFESFNNGKYLFYFFMGVQYLIMFMVDYNYNYHSLSHKYGLQVDSFFVISDHKLILLILMFYLLFLLFGLISFRKQLKFDPDK